jgi:hypothetical protein
MDLKIVMQSDSDNPDVGDIYLENGTVRLTNGLLEEVAQRLRISLLMFQGEWFLDPSQGMPWFQSILGVKSPLSTVQRLILSAISQQPGVDKVNSFAVTQLPNRGLSISFQLTLTNGKVLNSSDFAPFVVGTGA